MENLKELFMTQTLSDELSGQDKDQASSKGDIRADPTQTNGLEQDEYLKDNNLFFPVPTECPNTGSGVLSGVPHAVKLRVKGLDGCIPLRNSWHAGASDPPGQRNSPSPTRSLNHQANQRSFSAHTMVQEKADASLEFTCPSGIPDSPEVSPVRYRPVSRNHSLKYSGGALHDTDQPLSFDHNFDSVARDPATQKVVGGNQQPRRQINPNPRPPIVEMTHSVTPPQRPHRNLSKDRRTLSKSNSLFEDDSDPPDSPTGSHRSRSMRLPPLVRVQTELTAENGARLPRTRASYSLSRTEELKNKAAGSGDEDSDRLSRCSYGDIQAGESVSMYSRSSLQVSPSVLKSASMTNMSSGSDVDFLSNSVPTSEARKRSYLVGSVGPTSLLGTQELEKQFPDRTIRIFVGTWNMNGQVPPRHLAEFLLPANLKYVPDLLVVGTQETFPEKNEWEVRLQDTLGPSHVLFHSASLGTLHLTVFIRRDLIWYCSIPEDDSFSTRPGAQFKTKGAVAVAFILFGTSFMFVNSHLTAHQENVKDRVKDLKKIYAMLNLPKTLPLKKRHELFDSYDCCFWCGDLNFRLEQTREEIIRDIEDGVSVLETDQLGWLMSKGTIFRGFKEHPINFRPTYKYDPGTDKFDTSSKQRIPSYTDRILYKHSSSTPVRPLHYDSVQGVVTSDHKPVWGMFEVRIRPGKDSVPLAGGLFNRQVYLEGLKRRSESLKPIIGKGGSANMCNVS
eukprot:TRINITY_DN37662_c0_g1_i1.p1 TRINITY_DN37662_c0_g1~~TRINITY_DN37662_c0_g1_i1.p1  ORF type:complete len:731 (-),score=111.96 TRINITY_DN37662_c0_g1_i1:103-2295(-)